MSTLTAANSVFALAIAGLYSAPQILQGYSTDDAFATDEISPVETMMGVDGKLSGGFVPNARKVKITLQADSASNKIFDDWNAAQETAKEVYIASGVIALQGTGQKYQATRGFLTGYSPMPAAKKVLQPRTFEITFESITPVPV